MDVVLPQAPASDIPLTFGPAQAKSNEPAPVRELVDELRVRFPRVFEPDSPERAREIKRHQLAMESLLARQRQRDPDSRAVSQFGRVVGARHEHCRFDNYEIIHPGQREVVEALTMYAADFPAHEQAGEGLILFGPAGTGKDHLLAAVAREVVGRFHVWPTRRRGLDLFAEFRDRIDTAESELRLVRELAGCRLLILSDPLPPRGPLTDWQAGLLLSIIDARYENLRPTWISVNVSNRAEADERMGAQTFDRLRDGALAAFCNWPSYRALGEVVNSGTNTRASDGQKEADNRGSTPD